ncbi:FAD-dependent pyridine nucleotide-disulfide oxidoreductase [Streptomyces noursei ZPM]|uniref:Pyridine nucleotide-disulfide oxidoreductase n=1 Tax=Streptomyces noursei TaxID=1971 RepID=A0A059W9X7_STRNR|nr:FAD-dependent oxidoreductase [Streptomyces noursei]AKA07992.1 FAD-dependent pyridine nucleotide-disulfide oxidoreductase [Streptomyces noursei ZPM]AIA08309.1 FAD-dependent pyridine nucleotide-disulfide oxidoreductase [Streptomyces noursei]EXU90117.1 pyridine nucleotide-disulfide oxidoreductase [Streptomyces noursei PD-1]UWS76608.1 FAD-dependent oxidoreductase [Streptomyces noursei]GCB87667.1 pyridine nucleotide-disulfide oxidoreductase [Streptomyces noursei]
MTQRQVVVIGAGPAGMAAAEAALRAGARVMLIDAAEHPGGQYHRMPPDAYAPVRPRRLQRDGRAFDRRRSRVLGHPRCTWCPETMVWALERRDPDGTGGAPPPRVHLLHGPADGSGRRRSTVDPDALVLAVGAHDRVLPFPGWELPGVFTAGAAQALAKGERVVVGDRVVVAGTGPFLLPVAAALMEAGTQVRAVLEANVPGTVVRGWSRRGGELAVHTAKIRELCRYGGELVRHRVPYRFGRAVVAARGAGRVEEVVTARLRADWSVVPGSERSTAVDALCVSHGFSPQLELPLAAGCALRGRTTASPAGEFVAVDADQRTSVAGVYAAGEITGIAGAPAARAEGAVAGWIAGGGDPGDAALRRVRRHRDQGRAFAARLARAHPIGPAWPGWLAPRTVICRCEETDYAQLRRAVTQPAGAAARVAKLATRAGLGPCQARICGPTVAELAARLRDGPAEHPTEGLPPATPHRRPIAQPIRLGELAAPPARHDPPTTPPAPTKESE